MKTWPEAHLASAMIKIYADWDKTGVERAYQRALELNPSLALAHAHYAWYLDLNGNVDEALAEMYRAQELDPLTPKYAAWQGWLYFWEGYNDEAIEEALKSLELNPDFPMGLYVLGAGYAAKGMYEEAIAAHQKAGAISPKWKWGLGQTFALVGRKDEALAVAIDLEINPEARKKWGILENRPEVWNMWGIAEIYTAMGDKDKAFHWLEEAYKQRHPYIQWFMRNGNFDPLQDDPRYKDLAQRLNLVK